MALRKLIVRHLIPALALAASLSGMPLPGVDEWVVQEFFEMGLTPDEVIWHTAQVEQESSFRTLAESPWAKGLAQFTDPTRGDWWPRVPGCEDMVDFPFDPMCNLLAMRKYMLWLYDKSIAMGIPPRDAHVLSRRGYNGGFGWNQREYRLCQATFGCDPTRWRDLVEICQATGRSHAACRENSEYPVRIEEKTKRKKFRAGVLKALRVGLKAGAAAGVPGASIANEAIRSRPFAKVPRK